jgi:hypothetical protein
VLSFLCSMKTECSVQARCKRQEDTFGALTHGHLLWQTLLCQRRYKLGPWRTVGQNARSLGLLVCGNLPSTAGPLVTCAMQSGSICENTSDQVLLPFCTAVVTCRHWQHGDQGCDGGCGLHLGAKAEWCPQCMGAWWYQLTVPREFMVNHYASCYLPLRQHNSFLVTM